MNEHRWKKFLYRNGFLIFNIKCKIGYPETALPIQPPILYLPESAVPRGSMVGSQFTEVLVKPQRGHGSAVFIEKQFLHNFFFNGAPPTSKQFVYLFYHKTAELSSKRALSETDILFIGSLRFV